MKKINIKLGLFLLLVIGLIASCTKFDNPVTGDAKEGGLIEIRTPAIIYKTGLIDSSFDITLKYYQGVSHNIKSIEVFKQFFTGDTTSTGEKVKSENVLFNTIDLSDKTTTNFTTYTASFNQLRDGLNIDGEPIEADSLLKPGYYWLLTYVMVLDDGRRVIPTSNTIFVNARFAGQYRIVKGKYKRSTATPINSNETDNPNDWNSTYVVNALNATTYEMVGVVGISSFVGNRLVFTIEGDKISYPKKYEGEDQKINGIVISTCEADPGNLPTLNCDFSNYVVKMPSGKDTLDMSVGYFNPGGAQPGPREIYMKLVRK